MIENLYLFVEILINIFIADSFLFHGLYNVFPKLHRYLSTWMVSM